MTQVLDFAKQLIAAPSVTPATGAVFDALEALLGPFGFEIKRFIRGSGDAGGPEAPVEVPHGRVASRRVARGVDHDAVDGPHSAIHALGMDLSANLKPWSSHHFA